MPVALAAGALLAACGASGNGAPSAAEHEADCEPATVVAELPAILTEVSGVSRDPRTADLVWAHNDSGNPAELFALDRDGRVVARSALTGATDRDIEDVAVGACGDVSCLLVGDIGDNLAVRPFIHVHRVILPDDLAPPSALEATATWTLAYPTGPRDAESLVVDPDRGELIIVTKGREGVVEMYAATLAELGDRAVGSAPDTLRRVGALAIPVGDNTSQLVTGADLSPDSRRLAVRSYTTLFLFDWDGVASFDTTAIPRHASLLAALEAQGEGVAWNADGETLTLVSEGRGNRPPTISRIRCP